MDSEGDSINLIDQSDERRFLYMAQGDSLDTDYSSESSEEADYQKHTEFLATSHKVKSEPSSDATMIPKTEDEHLEKGGSQASFVAMSVPASMYQTSTRQFISVTQRPIHIGHAMSDGMTGLPNSGTQQPGPRLVPYAPPIVDGTQQFFMPSQIIVPTASEDMPTYQIRIPTSALPQGIEVAAPPNNLHNAHQTEDATRKRELRLMKNREAARECRKKKKEYVKCLENRVAVLENQNKTLIEELKALKDLYCHKAE